MHLLVTNRRIRNAALVWKMSLEQKRPMPLVWRWWCGILENRGGNRRVASASCRSVRVSMTSLLLAKYEFLWTVNCLGRHTSVCASYSECSTFVARPHLEFAAVSHFIISVPRNGVMLVILWKVIVYEHCSLLIKMASPYCFRLSQVSDDLWCNLSQWRTQEFCGGGVQQIQLRTEGTGIWGR